MLSMFFTVTHFYHCLIFEFKAVDYLTGALTELHSKYHTGVGVTDSDKRFSLPH